ncbi:hypothetical protein OG563_07290 [Nocardia vinacea]|uniref:Uncharacterized protein n=1 Tax=Nocardia vinacea TaxID=96468 RepID=A0ABZ1Z1N8_9NOCA|nr:hypothetical protein [Nocardia vinacea]
MDLKYDPGAHDVLASGQSSALAAATAAWDDFETQIDNLANLGWDPESAASQAILEVKADLRENYVGPLLGRGHHIKKKSGEALENALWEDDRVARSLST